MSKWAKYHFTPLARQDGMAVVFDGFEGMIEGLWSDDIYYSLEEINDRYVSANVYWSKMYEIYKDDPEKCAIVMSKLLGLQDE